MTLTSSGLGKNYDAGGDKSSAVNLKRDEFKCFAVARRQLLP